MWGWLAGAGVIVLVLILVFVILPLYFWIKNVIRLSKKPDKTGMWVCLLIGLFLSPLIGWIVGSFLGKDE